MNHGTLQLRRFMYKTAVIIEMLVAVVGVLDWFYIYKSPVGINIKFP